MAKKNVDSPQVGGERAESFESKFRMLFDNLGDEVHLWKLIRNESGEILTWKLEDANPSALKSWGKSRNQVIGKTPDEIFGSGTRCQFLPTVKKIFETGKPISWVQDFEPTKQYLSMTSIPLGDSFISTGRDITQKKLVENALKESRDLLQKAELVANQGSWKWDIQNDTFSFSENWLRIHGFDESGINRESLMKIAHPEDRQEIQKALELALANKKPYALEHRIIKHNTGEVRWVKSNGELYLSPDGKAEFLIGVAQDITEHRQAEEALKESEDFLNKTGEIAKVGGWVLKGDFSKPYWTATTRKIHEVPDDFIPTIENAIEFYHPDDRGLIKKAVERAIETGQPFEVELRLITAKGNEIWVLALGQPEMLNGKCVKLSGAFQDITERKNAEAALKKSEQNFKQIFQSAAVAKILADEDGNYLDANERACELTGYSYDELTSMNVSQLVKAKHRTPKELYNKFLDKGYEVGEVELIRKEGERCIAEYFAREISDGQYLSTLIDVTDEKRIEKEREQALNELKQSEEKIRTITNSVPGTIYQFKFEKDGSYSMPFISERANELLGFELDQMKDVKFLFSRIHRDDLEPTLNSIMEANKENSLWSSEFRALNRNNEIVWIKGYSYGQKGEDGDIIHSGVFLDITEKKKFEEALKTSEQKHRNLTDNLPGMALQYKLSADGSDELLYISSGVKDLYEVSAEDAMADNSILWDRVHKDDLAEYTQSIKSSAESLKPWKYEHRLEFPDGRLKWVYMSGIPNKQSDGSVVWDSIGLDITEKKKAEQDLEILNNNLERRVEERTEKILKVSKEREEALRTLKETQSQLIQSEKMASLGVLTAGVAHEINNPLNYILGGYSAICDQLSESEKIGKEEIGQYLDWIKQGVDRASMIVTSLNHFSRTTEERNEKCKIHLIIEDSLLVLQQKHKHKIEIIKNFHAENDTIIGNNGRLHQAILNILSNAIDSIQNNGRIEISTKLKNGRILITIEDNGCGIPEKIRDRVKDPFFTTKPPGEGTGLGLSITYTIVKEHKGLLSFKSVVNEGTVFFLDLPGKEL